LFRDEGLVFLSGFIGRVLLFGLMMMMMMMMMHHGCFFDVQMTADHAKIKRAISRPSGLFESKKKKKLDQDTPESCRRSVSMIGCFATFFMQPHTCHHTKKTFFGFPPRTIKIIRHQQPLTQPKPQCKKNNDKSIGASSERFQDTSIFKKKKKKTNKCMRRRAHDSHHPSKQHSIKEKKTQQIRSKAAQNQYVYTMNLH
jgi:hypothetical protein